MHVTSPDNASKRFRPAQHAVFHAPVLAFIPGTVHWNVTATKRGVSPFPENIGLVTLEHRKPGTVLMRLQHLYGVNEDAVLSQPAKITLQDVFKYLNLNVVRIDEVSLTANQLKSAMNRLRWNNAPPVAMPGPVFADVPLELTSLQIRSFLLQLA